MRSTVQYFRKMKTKSFLQYLGNPRFISAPMVDHSSLSWRLLVRQSGTDLAFTQMFNVKIFVQNSKYRNECMDFLNYERFDRNKSSESQHEALERNLIAQFAGHDPNTLVQAGRFIENKVAAIDLNLGCPQHIAKRGNYGAYLLSDPDLIIECLSKMVRELKCPITAKIRRLKTDEQTLDLARRIQDCGVSMLTVHGRRLEDKGQTCGPANWDIIRRVKDTLSIPVIANGGISSHQDALHCLEQTGADGVMSSEALLENPLLFSSPEIDQQFQHNYLHTQFKTLALLKDLSLCRESTHEGYPGHLRSHIFKICHQMLKMPPHHHIRERIGGNKIHFNKSTSASPPPPPGSLTYDSSSSFPCLSLFSEEKKKGRMEEIERDVSSSSPPRIRSERELTYLQTLLPLWEAVEALASSYQAVGFDSERAVEQGLLAPRGETWYARHHTPSTARTTSSTSN